MQKRVRMRRAALPTLTAKSGDAASSLAPLCWCRLQLQSGSYDFLLGVKGWQAANWPECAGMICQV